ncbi:MAG TPA: hypothetical protein VFQ68_09740 [Streptosporangiaceae bacterium]|nr:hypothetical protein [Streptosporangiaceae bacterium]
MTADHRPVVPGRAARTRVAQSGYRPGVAQVRLVGPPETIDAALQLLADLCGDAWQPSTRKPGRHAGGDELQYGTLIVPVARG